jgi:anti-anti-sigma regulatory factor
MSSTIAAIPLDERPDDDAVVGMGHEVRDSGERAVTGASLAMREYGLLASPRVGPDADRRMEDWIASQIDLSLDIEPAPRPRNVWNQLIKGLPALRRIPQHRPVRGGPETAFADWSRFRVAYRRGITVVRLIDPALVKERHVRELTRDLIELIEAGNHRLLLNFEGVHRLGSWVALAIDEVYRRAKAADGGELKVCGLSDPLAAVLDLAGMAPGIELHAEEDSA